MNRIKERLKDFLVFYAVSAGVGSCALLGLYVIAAFGRKRSK